MEPSASEHPDGSGPEAPVESARLRRFRDDVSVMKVGDDRGRRERLVGLGGAVMCAVSVVLAVVAVVISTSTSDPLRQRDAIVIGLLGVTLAVIGAALAARWSVGRLLRFWLARLTFEHGHQTDRLVEALSGGREPTSNASSELSHE